MLAKDFARAGLPAIKAWRRLTHRAARLQSLQGNDPPRHTNGSIHTFVQWCHATFSGICVRGPAYQFKKLPDMRDGRCC